MIYKQPRYILAVITVLFSVRTALTCSVQVDPNNPGYDPIAENGINSVWFFVAATSLIVADVFVVFFTRRRFFLPLLIAVLITFVQIGLLIFMNLIDSCGSNAVKFFEYELYVVLVAVVVQFGYFVFNRRSKLL